MRAGGWGGVGGAGGGEGGGEAVSSGSTWQKSSLDQGLEVDMNTEPCRSTYDNVTGRG